MAKKKTTKKAVKKAVSAAKKPNGNGNSTSFKKGNTARKGRKSPQGKQKIKFADAFKSAITESDMIAIAKALVKKAKSGEAKAAKEVLDRCLGKPMQSLEIAGKDGGPLKLNVTVTKTYKDAS